MKSMSNTIKRFKAKNEIWVDLLKVLQLLLAFFFLDTTCL